MATIYPIIPAGTRPFYIMIPAIIILVGGFFLLAWTLYGSQRAQLVLSSEGLKFTGDVWGRKTIPLGQIRPREARLVNLNQDRELSPTSRRWGTGLPGYASGWFRLRNGEKALLFVTNWHRVVYIPTDRGHSILASVAEPEALLTELRATASR